MANPNHLLVEDRDTLGAVVGLMKQHIPWGNAENEWPTKIEVRHSSDEVLDRRFLKTKLKESGLRALGLIVDADGEFEGRWQNVKAICEQLGGICPEQCPEGGLILDLNAHKFGVWIMPDNKSGGMLENFCHTLVPAVSKGLWEFACQCAQNAKAYGASYKVVHTDKAYMHTWLAWQDPPGERMGSAITKQILRNETASAMSFVRWFRELYGA